MTQALSLQNLDKINTLVAKHKNMPKETVQSALLPLLHAIQDDVGWIPEESYLPISKALALSVAEVHGVVTFYHHLASRLASMHNYPNNK